MNFRKLLEDTAEQIDRLRRIRDAARALTAKMGTKEHPVPAYLEDEFEDLEWLLGMEAWEKEGR